MGPRSEKRGKTEAFFFFLFFFFFLSFFRVGTGWDRDPRRWGKRETVSNTDLL